VRFVTSVVGLWFIGKQVDRDAIEQLEELAEGLKSYPLDLAVVQQRQVGFKQSQWFGTLATSSRMPTLLVHR
jgi:hypothetical protein